MGRVVPRAIALATGLVGLLAFAGAASPAKPPGPGIAAALTISATPDSPTSLPGDQNGYTVTVHNPNIYAVDLCSLSAELPADFSYVSGSTTGFITADPDISGQTLTWVDSGCFGPDFAITQLTSIPAGDDASVHFDVTVATTPGDYFAEFSGGAVGDSVTSTGPTAKITVVPATDLSVGKTDRPDPILEGHLLTYTLRVRNEGFTDAENVVVTDDLPLGDVEFVAAETTQGSCKLKNTTVKCLLGTIPEVGEATVKIVVKPFHSGELLNTAEVSSDTADPNTGNNTDSARTTVIHLPHTPIEPSAAPTESADLSLTKTASATNPAVGQNFSYTLTVKNAGPGTASGVVVTDPLPAGVALVSASPSQGSCVGALTCSLGTLAAGAQATINVVVTATQPGAQLNTATVSASTPDPVAANGVGSVTVGVQAPDLMIEKRASLSSVAVGQNVSFALIVTNNGLGTANGVVVSDPLPAGLSLVSATPSQGSCAGAVTCTLGTLAQGAQATVLIVVKATKAGTAVNVATVSLPGDPNPTNDRATAQVRAASINGQPTGDVLVNGRPYDGGPIPDGARINVKNGKLKMGTDDGVFDLYGAGLPGEFIVRNLPGVTELKLVGGNMKVCSTKGLRTTSSRGATPPKKKKTTFRRLFANGKGKFRTRGVYAAATVRGTFFVLSDRCDGTFTSVREGSVTVDDLVKKKKVIVGRGRSYLAAKP